MEFGESLARVARYLGFKTTGVGFKDQGVAKRIEAHDPRLAEMYRNMASSGKREDEAAMISQMRLMASQDIVGTNWKNKQFAEQAVRYAPAHSSVEQRGDRYTIVNVTVDAIKGTQTAGVGN